MSVATRSSARLSHSLLVQRRPVKRTEPGREEVHEMPEIRFIAKTKRLFPCLEAKLSISAFVVSFLIFLYPNLNFE